MTTAIIGGLNELGRAYTEVAESPSVRDARVYVANDLGWYIDRIITCTYSCFKRDLQTVLGVLNQTPDVLYTNAGANNNGSPATRINWGGGYELTGVTQPTSRSPSICRIQATYRKRVPEVVASPPSGLTIVCAAGVVILTWLGRQVLRLDGGTGSCTTGLEFVKAPLRNISTTPGAPNLVSPLYIYANGTMLQTFQAPISTGGATAGEGRADLYSYGGLYWRVAGTNLKLIWANATVWDFTVP